MYKVSNLWDNDDVKVIQQLGPFTVIEYQRDLSLMPSEAIQAYFAAEMNVKKRQLICTVDNTHSTTLQPGAMQLTVGNVNATTGVKGVGDLLKKSVRGSVTGESAIKPVYNGEGLIVCEPTYKHIILVDLAQWNNSIVLDDGLFLACESHLQQKAIARSNVSSAIAGGEGLFNLCVQGNGIVALESKTPIQELICVELQNDTLKVDGNMAIAWSDTLQFNVERSGKSLLGSAASGEGLVNCYRGTGRVLIATV